MRLNLHYLYAFIILTVYGGQVCPFVESLSAVKWGAEVLALLGLSYIVRSVLTAYVLPKISLYKKSYAQLVIDFSAFAFSGILSGIFNTALYEFPPESGLKLLLGWITFAFFISIDMALKRERTVADLVKEQGRQKEHIDEFVPLTRKFVAFAVIGILLTNMIFFLVVIKDVDWIITMPDEMRRRAALIIFGEVLFISGVIISLMSVLIFSFSGNMKLFFSRENDALTEVLHGNLDARVPVSSYDEFGVMAVRTNEMIESLRIRTDELLTTQDITIRALASLAETRDNETGMHIKRTQRYVYRLALALRERGHYESFLDDGTVGLLMKSAPLHDIGKVGIPDSILLKPGKLTDDEFKIMKRHPYFGYKALKTSAGDSNVSSFLELAMEISLTHHEKWDGSGYPKGLSGEDIPLSGRLMALADVYDALISERVYKPAFSQEKAVSIIKEGRGSHFDPVLTDVFCEVSEVFREISLKYKDA